MNEGGAYYDDDKEAALTVAQFVLSPDIPPSERKHFEKFYLMMSKIMALGNIERYDIFPLIIAFDEICMLLEIGLFEEARQIMGKELMKMQASRSIKGFWTLYGQQGIQRSEHIEKVMSNQRQKKSFGSRVSKVFGGKKKEEKPNWGEDMK